MEEDINKALKEIESLTKKLEANPDSMVFAPLADAYRKASMLDQAEEVCSLGLAKHPEFSSARVVLGRIYLEKKEYDKAVEEFQKVVKVEADNLMANTMVGHALVGRRSFKEAVAAFQRAMVLNPGDAEMQKALDDAVAYSKGLREPPPDVPEEDEGEEKKDETATGRNGEGASAVAGARAVKEGAAPEGKLAAKPARQEEKDAPAKAAGDEKAAQAPSAEKVEGAKIPAPKQEKDAAAKAAAARALAEMRRRRKEGGKEEEAAGDRNDAAGESGGGEAAAVASSGVTASLKVAEMHMKKGDYAKALPVYEEVVAADAENIIAHRKLEEARAKLADGGESEEQDRVEETAAKEEGTAVAAGEAGVAMLDLDAVIKEEKRQEKADGKTLEDKEEPGGGKAEKAEEDEEAVVAKEQGQEPSAPAIDLGLDEIEGLEEVGVGLAEGGEHRAETPSAEEPVAVAPTPASGELAAVLDKLNETSGIMGSMLVSPEDGSVLEQVLTIEVDTSEISAMVADIYKNVGKSVESLNQGKLTQVLITARDGQVFLNVTSHGILTILANEKIRIGMLRLALKEAVKEIEEGYKAG